MASPLHIRTRFKVLGGDDDPIVVGADWEREWTWYEDASQATPHQFSGWTASVKVKDDAADLSVVTPVLADDGKITLRSSPSQGEEGAHHAKLTITDGTNTVLLWEFVLVVRNDRTT